MPLCVSRFLPNSIQFLSHCNYTTYQAGDTIVDVNQAPESLYYILYGHVTIFIPSQSQGCETIKLASLYSGDFFGELGLFTEKKQRSAQVQAITHTAIAEIDYPTFKKLTREDTDILIALSSQLADRLCATSRRLNEFILLERHTRKVCADKEEERRKLLLDPLTEVSNRQSYIWRIDEEFARWRRNKRPLSLAICDIDFFKKINDEHGHLAGDSVLQVIAKTLKNRLRTSDFIARYGGEEFVILLPETKGPEALLAMNSARNLIERCPLSYDNKPLNITISCGITEFCDGDDTPEAPFKRADDALYQAKNSGRNKALLL